MMSRKIFASYFINSKDGSFGFGSGVIEVNGRITCQQDLLNIANHIAEKSINEKTGEKPEITILNWRDME